MHYAQLYQESICRLSRVGIEDARSDVTVLFEWCFGLTRSRIVLQGDQDVDPGGLVCFKEALARRAAREPLHYIIGVREFWSLDFIVSPAVLVPRPETEFLLEHIISTVGKAGFHGGPVLDMCTGSGIIAVILALEFGAGTVVAVDRSPAALQVARRNIHKHGVEGAVSLVCSDLFTAFRPAASFELIVANPPYIAEDEFPALQPEVREWEPRSALVAGRDGLDIIHLLAGRIPFFLQPGGWLFFEIGAAQKDAVSYLFSKQGDRFYDCVDVVSDWSGRPRVLRARRRS